jgi:hypothetical protein
MAVWNGTYERHGEGCNVKKWYSDIAILRQNQENESYEGIEFLQSIEVKFYFGSGMGFRNQQSIQLCQ